MKRIRLITATMLICATALSAAANNHHEAKKSAEVLVISSDGDGSLTESLYTFENPEEMKKHARKEHNKCNTTKHAAAAELTKTINQDQFQGVQAPMLVFAQKDNKFSFGVGGYINLRTSYDFNGIVENIDFVTADIPTTSSYDTRQQIMMDASTSRLYFTGIVNTRAVGAIRVFADMDFRGNTGWNDTGVTNTYQPRLRTAYVNFLGITAGRDITTFCDLSAAPQTIDFQGPNAYSFNYATLLRYTYSCVDDRLEMAVALEMPNLSATYGDAGNFEAIPQRVPDVPMYIQYRLGKKMEHHIRVSAVLRDMYAYNVTSAENTSLLGWGVQFSGNLQPLKWLNIRLNSIYGKGITPYIQDLIGSGLDFTPDPSNATSIEATEMYAWQAALKFNITKKLSLNGGYSTARVRKDQGYYADDEYRVGQYAFGNIFYDITPRLKVAAEYLYGSRKNMDCLSNTANRVSAMAQFNF
ncbi:MAG: DcaP family trimeric outer membrane transporter [Rikenellaceae bacterium]